MSVNNWAGAWFGFIRNITYGNVLIANNLGFPDSNEVATNTIHGNLTCFGNNPVAEFGDSGGTPNIVHRPKARRVRRTLTGGLQ